MSKSITEQEVTQRMMDRWTLELANWLMSEKDLDRNAFRSFATWRLINVYQDGRGV